ncbi:unnamed protein product [Rangifer tarandus platyrhynchus]|uniref:Uncharacterized protein n=1 Tax=Rangifer tarandus platyrhynchus TaxID=3082113 RepID=A0ABN8XT37_RANTA|nr:unnamed protein product [Rangifer tarandus platyrhynchus]
MNYQQQLANSAAIRAEIQRFESVHPNIYSIYELLERVEEPVLQNQIREHVIAIEGEGRAAAGLLEGGCARASVPGESRVGGREDRRARRQRWVAGDNVLMGCGVSAEKVTLCGRVLGQPSDPAQPSAGCPCRPLMAPRGLLLHVTQSWCRDTRRCESLWPRAV